MASIIKKKIKDNNYYYYYVESKRINGKLTYVNQRYLGTAESVLSKLSTVSSMPEPLYSVILDFADVALLIDIAKRLRVTEVINKYAKKRNQGVSVGDYILLAAINRAVAPTSKSDIAKWYAQTILSRLLPVNEKSLSSQNYWNHMCLSDDILADIDCELVRNIVDIYKVDTTHLIYDATNFFTYIDTMQDSSLAKRGHCKSKRNDLRIVGLSMMITPDCNIPLLYDTYPGNMPDSKQFSTMLNKLKARYEQISSRKSDITIVFDRGNNSQDNIDLLEQEQFPLFYVGGLKRNQCADLFEIDKTLFAPVTGKSFEKVTAYRTTKNVYNRDMTVIVTYNQNLSDGQMQGILMNIEKTYQTLFHIQIKLLNRAYGNVTKGRAPSSASIEKQVKSALKTEFMEEVFDFELSTFNGLPSLQFNLNEGNLESLKNRILGKTVLFTNRHSWTTDEIVASYRSAWHIEHAFRQMKNPDHLTVRPLFHWTDQKIKIHIFYCVLAYRLCCLLQKELSELNINDSLNHILDELKDLKYVITILGTAKSDILCSFSKGSFLAEQIASHYDLKVKYLPDATN
jgi:transposase